MNHQFGILFMYETQPVFLEYFMLYLYRLYGKKDQIDAQKLFRFLFLEAIPVVCGLTLYVFVVSWPRSPLHNLFFLLPWEAQFSRPYRVV
jgi:hypothetical protein